MAAATNIPSACSKCFERNSTFPSFLFSFSLFSSFLLLISDLIKKERLVSERVSGLDQHEQAKIKKRPQIARCRRGERRKED